MKLKESKWFQKLKSIKHIEYIILGIFLCVVLLIAFSGSLGGGSGKEPELITLNEYARQAEERLNDSLSQISGAGRVKTQITYECGIESIPAYSADKNSIIMSGGKPVILKEIEPKVKGIIIIAEGATDARVRMELYKAVITLLDVSSANIEIFAMTKN